MVKNKWGKLYYSAMVATCTVRSILYLLSSPNVKVSYGTVLPLSQFFNAYVTEFPIRVRLVGEHFGQNGQNLQIRK